jgi:hypothetical protein
MKGYVLMLESIFAAILLFSLLFFLAGKYEYDTEFQLLRETGEDSLLVLAEQSKLDYVFSNHTKLNQELRQILPEFIDYNVRIKSQTTTQEIINGQIQVPSSRVSYFLSGNSSYNPREIELVLWLEG